MARLTPETERLLRKAVAGLPFLKRSEAKDELRAHLEDAIQQRLAQGSERELAEREAVAALGSADVLNRELLRAHFGRSWLLQLLNYKLIRWIVQVPSGPLGFLARVERTPRGPNEEAIERLERELATRGPGWEVYVRLGSLYSASAHHELALAVKQALTGDRERYQAHKEAAENKRECALAHQQAAVEWLKAHPVSWRFVGGQQRALAVAYSQLAGILESLGRDDEAEAAVRAGLAVDDEFCGLNFQKAHYCLKRGDLDGTFYHLDASLDDNLTNGDHGKGLLFMLHTNAFEPLRKDKRFGHLLRRADECP